MSIKIIKFLFRNFVYFVLILLSLIFIGLLELMKAGFNFSIFKQADFWLNIITMCLASLLMICMALSIKLNRIETNLNEGTPGLQAKQLREAVNIGSANINNDIDRFIAETNLKRKKEAWKAKIKTEIFNLSNTFSMNDHIQYAQYEKSPEYFNINQARSKVRKRILLEEKLNNTYIDNNILNLKVRYTRITRQMIENGQLGYDDSLDSLSKSGKIFVKNVAPKFLLSISFTLFISSFYFDTKQINTINVIISFAYKLIILIINANFGRQFAKQFFNETTIHDLQLRRQWLTKYSDWRESKQKSKMMESVLKSDLQYVHEEETKRESK